MLVAILLIIMISIGIMILVFKPKDYYQKDISEILITRTTLAMFISAVYLGLCYLYFFETNWSISGNAFQKALAIIFEVPMLIVYAFMYGGGERVGWMVIIIEWSILVFLVRFIIPRKWVEKLREWIK